MPKEQSPGKPTTRRYSAEEKAAAARMVRSLRAELGTEQGTVQRVARRLGYGVESVRTWVRQADIDEGLAPGVTTSESKKVQELECVDAPADGGVGDAEAFRRRDQPPSSGHVEEVSKVIGIKHRSP